MVFALFKHSLLFHFTSSVFNAVVVLKLLLQVCFIIAVLCPALVGNEEKGELLYNGIRLPEIWPPREVAKDRSVKVVPYLQNIPSTLPIDVGRQLFVDDFLIESTSLERRFHYPKK